MTYRLIYKSIASDGLTDAELRSIAMFSAINNKAANIAGLLLHNDGQVMQVLEGPEQAVTGLYNRIKQDKRHSNVVTLYADKCVNPAFETWSMGYRPVDTQAEIDIFFALSKGSLESIIEQTKAGAVRENLKSYADNLDIKK